MKNLCPELLRFDARWEVMSGDERVACIEANRALKSDFPDETLALRQSLAAHRRLLERRAKQRAKFRAYRADYLTPPPVTEF